MGTFTKLRTGNWGVKLPGRARAGQEVMVQTRAGEQKRVVVGRVVWSGNDVSICTIASQARTATVSNGQEYCGGICPVRHKRCCQANGPCHDCI